MNFTFRQIRYFVAVADSFSVSRAAAELHISQSAVTSAIRELETELGAALFERNPRGVSLTTQGHQFLLHARRILGAMTEAGQSLKAVAQQDQGQLTIGVTTLVAGYYLSEALGRFRRAFPAVRIEVKEDEQPYLEHQIVNGEVDVGILMTNRTIRQEAFDTELLTRSPLRVWLAANHPLCAESTLSLKALGEEPMISLTADQLDQIIGGGLRRYGIAPRIVLRTASVEAVRSLVASQLGVALLPDFAYRPWSLEQERVEARTIKEPIPAIDIGLVWRRGSRLDWTAREFIDIVRDQSRLRARQQVSR
ncbi:LysR family transcriptional regulator [Aeromonas sp. MR19]|jgi:DNA-binding transcriptional LysR family regulator|uniref:LysR family transcriptional regulator n=1 Tax=Aeromonas bestiarum TaxID=105751 RepID=A0AAP4JD53_9GAMM|nr:MULTISPECIES: LysR family transcriptional regulator [Aeromonas]MDU1144874.1 LysR family transcriptional regulator [Aeromonas hydrophila]ATL98382.1 LysR family transcriptional regulator [Aeromonas sp. CA23]EKP0278488.1 LysR family transcriptional regulator [Aeromonas bestiarum]KFN19460.1 LysR family transcriptional regulator [Aeromonas bestiarum]MCH7348063.1 LysR family transcriptional regulator [Aeromonas sp. MR7]